MECLHPYLNFYFFRTVAKGMSTLCTSKYVHISYFNVFVFGGGGGGLLLCVVFTFRLKKERRNENPLASFPLVRGNQTRRCLHADKDKGVACWNKVKQGLMLQYIPKSGRGRRLLKTTAAALLRSPYVHYTSVSSYTHTSLLMTSTDKQKVDFVHRYGSLGR